MASLISGSLTPFAHLWTETERQAAIDYALRPATASPFRRAIRPIARPIGKALGIKRWPFSVG